MLSRVLGRYELQRLLGRGGMAEVYLARRRAGGVEKQLVIKRIRRERAGEPRFLDMFVNEARLSMSLSHQNVVPVFDFGRLGDDVFLAMEYVEGRDLGSTLARAGAPLPPLLAAHVASECCRALAYAHQRIGADGTPLRIVHRDVTPRNVLLSWAGEVKLTDFGIAALAGAADEQVRGTWAYMAPEQARGEVVDPRTDLYALGLVLWEMLAGKRARRGVDAATLAAEARSGELPPVPADVPAALAGVIARATAARPADRFADADAMLAELDAYVVAARAAERGAAPGRRLADWLAAIWGDQAGAPAGDAAAAGTMLTGDDDGDATMRSMAETAGDAPALAPPASSPSAANAPPRPAPPSAPTSRPASSPPGSSPPVSSAPVSPPPRRAIWLGAGVALAIAGLIASFAILRTPASPRIAAVALDAPLPDAALAAAVDASLAATLDAAPDAAPLDAAPLDATPADASRRPTRPDDAAGPSPRPADAATSPRATDAAAAAAVEPSDVTIGAVPWADFTVDDDPAVHQTPETIRLAPGRHRITFRNPPLGIERTVTITVPAGRAHRHIEHLADP